MGSFSIWHWIIVGIVILLLFGRGKISDLMGDIAKGIKSFKKGLAEDDDDVKKKEHNNEKIEIIDHPIDEFNKEDLKNKEQKVNSSK